MVGLVLRCLVDFAIVMRGYVAVTRHILCTNWNLEKIWNLLAKKRQL